MKIAIYLGSFDPFHKEHGKVVKKAFRLFKMDLVLIVPTMQNPWKKEKAIDFEKRIQIIWENIFRFQEYEYQRTKVCEIEKSLIPPYYSYATLHALKNKYCNDQLFILCGEDTIKDIPNWMNGEQIIKDYDFLIVDRPENSISSSEIRAKIKNNEDISNLVEKYTIDLIKKYYK